MEKKNKSIISNICHRTTLCIHYILGKNLTENKSFSSLYHEDMQNLIYNKIYGVKGKVFSVSNLASHH